MPGIMKSILLTFLAHGAHTTKQVQPHPPSPRTFPLLEAIFHDDFESLYYLLAAGHEQNRNFGVGTAVDYAHMYGKYEALEILKSRGGKSGAELGMTTVAMAYNPTSPRKTS